MTQILFGERIGKQGNLRIGCSAVIFDDQHRVLLTRRADNGQWCLPGGAMEAGESVIETCEREVWEETGLRVRIARLIGVYSNRDALIIYPDGNRVQMVVLNFEAIVIAGQPGLSNETTDIGYFTWQEIQTMDLLGHHKQRIADALNPTGQIILA